MTYENQDPDPRETPGLDSRGGVPAGSTPPAEGSMSEGGPRHEPPRGWGKGPLIAILVVAALVAAFFLVYALLMWT
ncbi:DUF6480 family protein [Streptomyces atroolivaceus]|uniref:DUF6480 family protein n=1 Tax=Streptomyces atroolivaceus TaxID=66869 RepID=UPI00379F1110